MLEECNVYPSSSVRGTALGGAGGHLCFAKLDSFFSCAFRFCKSAC